MSYPEHEPYHERRLDQQMLDALLRIEALLRSNQQEVSAKEPPTIVIQQPTKGKRK